MRRVLAKLARHSRGPELASAVEAVPTPGRRVSLLGAFLGADGKPQVAVSSTMSGLAILLATRTFLRSKWGL